MNAASQNRLREILEKKLDTVLLPVYKQLRNGMLDQLMNGNFLDEVIKGSSKQSDRRNSVSFELRTDSYALRGALTDMMNALIDYNCIDEDSKIKDFRSIFSGGKIGQQIRWIGSQPEIQYFIRTLLPFLKECDHWVICSNCFLNRHGTRYDSDKLRTIKQRDLSSKRKEEIEKCCNHLLSAIKPE